MQVIALQSGMSLLLRKNFPSTDPRLAQCDYRSMRRLAGAPGQSQDHLPCLSPGKIGGMTQNGRMVGRQQGSEVPWPNVLFVRWIALIAVMGRARLRGAGHWAENRIEASAGLPEP